MKTVDNGLELSYSKIIVCTSLKKGLMRNYRLQIKPCTLQGRVTTLKTSHSFQNSSIKRKWLRWVTTIPFYNYSNFKPLLCKKVYFEYNTDLKFNFNCESYFKNYGEVFSEVKIKFFRSQSEPNLD